MSLQKQQVVRELHRDARIRFPRRKYTMHTINETIQFDLIEMQSFHNENRGYRYILIAIDVFSKMAHAEPLLNKTGPETTHAMERIIRKFQNDHADYPIKHAHSDSGSEFFNSTMKRLFNRAGIKHYATFSALKASIVERLIRTIKRRLYMEFSLHGNYKWIDSLQRIMDSYNDSW